MTSEVRDTKGPGTGREKGRGSALPQVYAFGVALVLFFVSWAAIAARPWQEKPAKQTDPRVLALTARETQLRGEAVVVSHRLKRQWNAYEMSLARRQREIAAAQLRHEQEVAAAEAAAAAAARAALARLAAAPTTASPPPRPAAAPKTVATPSPTSEAAPAPPPPPPAPPPPPTVRVVVLPPEVQIVELPPITSSKSS